jgi:hypothetical protein
MKIEAMEDIKTEVSEVSSHKIVSKAQWLVARKDLLAREKELTHLRDEISRHRRELPWVKVNKHPNGQLDWKIFRATASSTRTGRVRSSTPTRPMVAAASNFSVSTGISTSRQKDEMRTDHTIR